MSKKTCFVVTAIGNFGTPTRIHSDKVLQYLIEPVCKELDFDVIRVDKESTTGNINDSIINHLKNDNLVIADMTEHNPNAFYELGFREALGLPLVPIIRKDERVPFDVASNRTVFYDTDVSEIENSKQQLKNMILSFENFDSGQKNFMDKQADNFKTIHDKLDKILNKIDNKEKKTPSVTKQTHDKSKVSSKLPPLDSSDTVSISEPLSSRLLAHQTSPLYTIKEDALSAISRRVDRDSLPPKK